MQLLSLMLSCIERKQIKFRNKDEIVFMKAIKDTSQDSSCTGKYIFIRLGFQDTAVLMRLQSLLNDISKTLSAMIKFFITVVT
jgi:hypothetical protein